MAQLDVQRLRELARPGAEVQIALLGTPLAHQVDSGQRLQRPDQNRGPDAGRLTHRIQQCVDAVGAVDIGTARRAEKRAVRGVRPTKA